MFEPSPGSFWVASFDIGKKNFAFYIEEINFGLLPTSKDRTYNVDGTPTDEMAELLESVYSNGKTILCKNTDLTTNCKKGLYLDPKLYHNMYTLLDEYAPYWDHCGIFVIEKQMSFGRSKFNTMAVKLGQHCYSYFVFKYGPFKTIVEFPAYHKTCVLGAPKVKGRQFKNGKCRWKGMSKPKRKKWCVEKATEILKDRGELSILDDMGKKDDVCDCVCQLQAFKVLYDFELYNKFKNKDE